MAIIVILLLLVGIGSLLTKASANNKFATRYVALPDVDNMDGHDFEYYCADLLKYDGFSRISVTKGSNDQGVDIIAYKNGVKYAIQCKRYSNSLGNKPVQEVNTGRTIYGCSQAVVLTNSFFTKGAIEAAKATGVLLWDRRKINSLIQAKQKGMNAKTRPALFANGEPIKKITALSLGMPILFFLILVVFVSVLNEKDKPIVTSSPDEQHLGVADNNIVEDLSITISKMMFARHTGNLKYLDMVDDDIINCCVYANVENNNTKSVDLSQYNAVLLCNGIEYQQIVVEDSEFLFANPTIEQNELLEGKVIDFQIPKDQQYSDSQIYFIIIPPNGQQISWQLR